MFRSKKVQQTASVMAALFGIVIAILVGDLVYVRYIATEHLSLQDDTKLADTKSLSGFSYDRLFSLIKKFRRLQTKRYAQPHVFLNDHENINRIEKLISELSIQKEEADRLFYTTVDRYIAHTTQIPAQLYRRLNYQRTVINRHLAALRHLKAVLKRHQEKIRLKKR